MRPDARADSAKARDAEADRVADVAGRELPWEVAEDAAIEALRNDGGLARDAGRDPASEAAEGQPAIIELATGDGFTCALRDDGNVTCWGDNHQGPSSAVAEPFVHIAAGRDHPCGLRSDGTVACWGRSFFVMPLPDEEYVQLSSGNIHTCGVQSDGTVSCGCKDNLSGQCDVEPGAYTCWQYRREYEGSPPEGTFLHVTGGGMESCGIRTDGTLVCWSHLIPRVTVPVGPLFTQIVTDGHFYCALDQAGREWCWGDYVRQPLD